MQPFARQAGCRRRARQSTSGRRNSLEHSLRTIQGQSGINAADCRDCPESASGEEPAKLARLR